MPSLMDVDMPPPARNFWVELPSLEPGSRSNPNLHYISGSQLKDDSSSVASDTDESSQAKSKDQDGDDGAIDLDDLQLQEIVGEYEWPGGAKYYYARLRSEEIRKARFYSIFTFSKKSEASCARSFGLPCLKNTFPSWSRNIVSPGWQSGNISGFNPLLS